MGPAFPSNRTTVAVPDSKADPLRLALHDVAQPLTTLSMLLDEIVLQGGAASSTELLTTARAECRRAVEAVRRLQTASASRIRQGAAHREVRH